MCSCITKKLFKVILNLYTCIQLTFTQPNIKRQNYIKVTGKKLVRQTCVNSVPVWFHSRKSLRRTGHFSLGLIFRLLGFMPLLV